MDAIFMEGLVKDYAKTRALDGVSLRVARGQFFGFIGPNGAGKSTAIRALLGLLSPTAGTARALGLDAKRQREKLLARVGYLPSEAAFYPGMRVREMLRFSASLRRRECARASAMLCERLWLDPAKKLDSLSFGERKKAAIAAALQHEPELLVLDEPTVGLDPLIQREFFEILAERNAAGATVFFSSHILSEIQRRCTHAAILRKGRIIASGPVRTLARADARRVSLRGRAELAGLRGVRDLRVTPDGLSFLYGGDMPALLAALAAGDVHDLSVSEPDLEEVFIHYYEGGANAYDDAAP